MFDSWQACTENMHEIIDQRSEPLYLTVRCDDSFGKDFYLELRQSKQNVVLYHSTMGFSNLSRIMLDIAKKHGCMTYADVQKVFQDIAFDMTCFINRQKIEKLDWEYIKNGLLNCQAPGAKDVHGGLDGHRIYFHTYFEQEAEYAYWVYPPEGCEHVTAVLDILGEYLARPERMILQRK